MEGQIVVPGQVLVPSSKGGNNTWSAGAGVHTRKDGNNNEALHASILGKVSQDPATGIVSVTKLGSKRQEVVPVAGSIVTGKVIRVNPRVASIEILCVGPRPLTSSFQGMLRKENVRATEIDRVDVCQSFRPGDIVRAAVASMGSARSYELTTAKNELGVIFARSEAADVPMIPISWQEMQCPVTMQVESRKVAKTSVHAET